MQAPLDASEALARTWRQARHVVVLTGAGLSTASGIPDFRSPGGRWERYQPVTWPEFVSSEAKRAEYWRYKGETWRLIRDAEPNPAHRALAELARAGRLDLLVTQNVDGLHARSGHPAELLIEIHGSDAEVVCLRCERREPREAAQRAWEAGCAVPLCACGGAFKPATISFGQGLVAADLERALDEAGRCDLLVAAGSTLVVGPVNQMLPVAHAACAATAILTASRASRGAQRAEGERRRAPARPETPFDDVADFRLTEPLEKALPRLRDAVLAP
jgi:NAD-dependent deacetylase